MKVSRKEVRCKAHCRPVLRFETQQLTAFGGVFVVAELLQTLGLGELLRQVFRHRQRGKVYRPQKLFMQLMVHLLLGFRALRDVACYRDDPLVARALGLKRVADPSTLSRMLKESTEAEVQGLRALLRRLVLGRLLVLALPRVTLDFDGSVLSTRRKAEGSAVGYNRKRRGERSYYPLFCTVAQTGQVLDLLHRPGNVHDLRGAREFILHCIALVRQHLPHSVLEVRMDSAFFSDEIVQALASAGVEFTVSVPFERLGRLKEIIERRHWWWPCGPGMACFEVKWKPQSWPRRYRFIVVRQEVAQPRKGPLQLDLFDPRDWTYEYKVIVTNKSVGAWAITRYHDGRGAQEGIFGELKQDVAMGRIPVRRRCGNQVYLLAGLMAHNLIRELQMRASPPQRRCTARRAALWVFEQLSTIRQRVLHRAGRLTRPGGRLTLTLNASGEIREEILGLRAAANAPTPGYEAA